MKQTISLLLAFATVVFLTACGKTPDDLLTTDAIITSQTSTSAETVDTTNPVPVRKSHDGMEQSFEALQQELEEALAQYDYPPTANELFRQILEDLYNNYDGWTLRSFGMPEKHDYIRTNLIDAIDRLEAVCFYERDSKRGKELRDFGVYSAMLNVDTIEFVYVPEKEESGRFRTSDEATFYHEIQHCIQNGEDLFNILGEGGATFHMRLVKPCGIYPKSGGGAFKRLMYEDDFEGGGYSLYGSLFTKLVSFAGYETVEKVEYGAPITLIRTELASKYGEDLADEIMRSLKIINAADEMDPEYGDLALSLEQNFLQCMETDIRQLDSVDAVRHYAEFFRYYKALLRPQIITYTEDSWDESLELTEEYLSMDTAEDLLVDKIVEYGAMNFVEDDALHRMAVYAALTASVEQDRKDNDSLYPPIDIMNTSYLYEETSGIGKLYMQYYNDFTEDERQMCVTFDADSILYYEEPDPYKEGLGE